jgi:excisionase family DNA binding protein
MTANLDQNENAAYTLTHRSPEPNSRDELLTVAEIAARLKVPTSWVYERTRLRGIARMPHFKLGKYLRFSEREVWEWLERTRGI